ncbi:hypothetical protein RHGRI_019385 [Rhododendron griersonianum]|uniref:DUF4220 domain-containing protein n=1 Tax=Rhododendron griersonianum TaxID=479676 RepID=A0AAV6JHS7_9ERIC|nr:hypothetical protein RHGRI_019385 [Rhododendron griersonianum]
MSISHLSPTPSPAPDPSSPYFPDEVSWKVRDIQALVLLSMLLQCFLFSCASERRRTNKAWLRTLISSAHFLADWVAPYTIGLISVRLSKFRDSEKERTKLYQGDPDGYESYKYAVTTWYLRFWAPFLLLHLGGPDNVTSLSAEENNMWLQQLIRLISQLVSTVLIFIRFPSYDYDFFLAPQLFFLAGTIRCMERVHSLYLARSGGFKESSATRVKLQAGPDFEKLSEAQRAMREANIPTQEERVQLPPKKFKPHSPSLRDVELVFDTDNDQLDEKSLLQFALSFYNNFKGLFFGGVSYSHEQRQFTRDFFLRRSSHDAFKLAEIELSFIHKDLHTKTGTSHLDGNPVARIMTLSLITAASVLYFQEDNIKFVLELFRFFRLHHRYGWFLIDIAISYALVVGALILEIVSLLMVLLSGRNVVAFNYYNWVKPIANAMVNMRKWKESFSKCSFICYYLRHRTPRQISFIADFLFIGPALEACKLQRKVTSESVSKSLKDKIFTELKTRSELAQNIEIATKLCSQRGDWILMQRSCYSKLKWSLGEVEYGRSFLLWHIATDLVCYNSKDCDKDASNSDHRFCKDISEYLLYLFLAKPTMIAPAAGNSVKIFQDTSLEAERLFHKRSITDHDQACQAILSVNTDIKPAILKGDASESVLFDACILAKQLSGFNADKRWSVMSGVWMVLLTYAAFHSKGTDHAHQPSQGGELLTFVWLLMNHLGLGKQFREERARTGYRVVVTK